jgi:hypothetical protein
MSNVVEMPTSRFISSACSSPTPKTHLTLAMPSLFDEWWRGRGHLSRIISSTNWQNSPAKIHRSLRSTSGEEGRRGGGGIAYLDKVIQTDLLPVMQEEAVNGTVLGLGRRDGFDPVLDRAVYNYPNSNEPQDVDVCIACQSV